MVQRDIPAAALRLTWADIVRLCVVVSQQVIVSGEMFDVVLMLQRGGAVPGMLLANMLGKNSIGVVSASIASYKPGGTEQTGELMCGQFPSALAVSCKRVLVVDEVCDSGKTLEYTFAKLRV